MTFKIRVEHEIVSGKTVFEEFENVEAITDPPMVSNTSIEFADDRETKNLSYGDVVRIKDEATIDA